MLQVVPDNFFQVNYFQPDKPTWRDNPENPNYDLLFIVVGYLIHRY